VNIYYSDNGGTQYVLVKTASGENGPQSTDWQIPATWGAPARNTIGADNKIKITDALDEINVSKESAQFEIRGQIKLTEPLGGTYHIGSTPIDITWEYAGNLGNIDIFFSSDGGTGWGAALATVDSSAYAQPYVLAVPDVPTTAGKIKIEQVSNRANVVFVTPDPGFAIKGNVVLDYPKAQVLPVQKVGDTLSIQWTLTGTIANVAIDYDKYSGNGINGNPGDADDYAGVVVASYAAAGGNYPWVIPDADNSAVSDNVRIRIRDKNDATVKDSGTVDFKIKPTISFIGGNNDAPLGGEPWIVNQPHTIKWTPKGFGAGEQVKIEYSDDGGSTWPGTGNYLINAGIAAAALQYSWPVPEAVTLSSKCVVRISKVGDSRCQERIQLVYA